MTNDGTGRLQDRLDGVSGEGTAQVDGGLQRAGG